MAIAPTLVSLEEYLHTSYSPDCEYIDGVVVERNVGQGKHAYTQTELAFRLKTLVKGLLPIVEQRVQVSETRVRIPDICLVAELTEVVNTPPALCAEVLSPDDRWSRVMSCISDYQNMGVPCVWVVDPYRNRAWIFDQEQPPSEIGVDGFLRAEGLGLEIRLAEVLPPSA